MAPTRLKAFTPANLIAGGITMAASLVVAIWAIAPVQGTIQYRLGTSHQGRAVLLPHYVPIHFDGFAGAEPWGRWTDRRESTITFGRPLPRRFTLAMSAHAFGPNVAAPIRICAADACHTISLGLTDITIEPTFETSRRVRRIVIHVPYPSAPGNGDERLLGVAIASVKVEEAR